MRTIVVWTGHRPPKLGGYNEQTEEVRALKRGLNLLVQQLGSDVQHITGGALGVDQWVAEAVLENRESYDLRLHVEMPFPGFDSVWPVQSQERLSAIVRQADNHEFTLDTYLPSAYQMRNESMLDFVLLGPDFGKVVAVWDGSSGGTANCVKSAKKRGIPVYTFTPEDLRKMGGFEAPPF
jgi:uncharacterized phage-like protein YoqJ